MHHNTSERQRRIKSIRMDDGRGPTKDGDRVKNISSRTLASTSAVIGLGSRI